ncbi:MAG: hypothetical protein M1838_004013 [Thelocarpon superellum]|nr:MAG: hypothetical protein M1838_004013 [Thelocarpon superellum]
MTAAMVSAIEDYHRLELGSTAPDLYPEEPSIAHPAMGNPIAHAQVIDVSRRLQKHYQSHNQRLQDGPVPSYSLHFLLRGSHVFVPPPSPEAEPTSEYKALMARLRRDEEQRAYNKLLEPSSTGDAPSRRQRFPLTPHAHTSSPTTALDMDDDDLTYADVGRQMALVINVLITIVACSVAIWMVASHWSAAPRLGLSMGGSGLVAVAEVVVYAGYLRRLKEAKIKGKRAVETKQVINTWVIEADAPPKVVPVASVKPMRPEEESPVEGSILQAQSSSPIRKATTYRPAPDR